MFAHGTHTASSGAVSTASILCSIATLALLAATGGALAADAPVVKGDPQAPILARSGQHYKIGEVDLSISGVVTIGTEIRTSGRDPWFVGFPNASVLGIRSFNVGGKNGDDGNLNYARGSIVSTVAKGFVTFDASVSGFGMHVRPKVWHDATLANSGVAWGNSSGGYLSGAPLGGAGGIHWLERQASTSEAPLPM